MENRDSNEVQLIYGHHPVVEAITSGLGVDKLFLQLGVRGELEKEVRQLSKKFNIPVQVVPKEKLNKLVKGNHQGIAAYVSLVKYAKLEDLLPVLFESHHLPLMMVLDGITDVRNFGAIARSAECLGAQALIISKKGGAPINAESIKTSAGALTRLPVCREGSLVNTLELLKLSGVQIVAALVEGEKMVSEVNFHLPTALILGSEGKGIHPALLQKADTTFYIPQTGSTDSLNVSVAAGIILYEVSRQRLS